MTTNKPVLIAFESDPLFSAMRVDPHYLVLIKLPAPKLLKLEELQDDIDKVIKSQAFHFTDQSCVFLHTDELEDEGRVALANVLRKGWLERARDRAEFFRIFKSAVANQFRSILQKHRYTQKRTGIKPPPRHERKICFESRKPNEISLNDPNGHLQVSDFKVTSEDVAEEIDVKQLAHKIKERCCWFERAVFEQLVEPDLDALLLAQVDGMRGKRSDRIEIQITNLHRAAASWPYVMPEIFEKAVLEIQRITKLVMEPNLEDERYQAAVARLAELFNLQITKSAKPMLLRRMLTICARDNWTLVTPEVEELLSTVGAAVPKFNKDSMQCLGVLYQKGHKICESCGVSVSCAVQSNNVGLTEVIIPPKLLASKLTRIPIILPNLRRNALPPTSNLRDMEVVQFLWDNFKSVTHQGETYFQPKDFTDKQKLMFCIGTRSIPFRLRFVNPSMSLRKKLALVNKCYYAPSSMSAADLIALIDEHAKMAYV